MAGEQSLVRLAEEMGTALLDWARSSSSGETYVSTENGRVVVKPDSILVFDRDKPQLDLELPRLARILINASEHAGSIFKYLSKPAGYPESKNDSRSRSSALRKAATIRDSFAQLSLLITGHDLDEIETIDIDDTFLSEREAEIYKRIKQVLQTRVRCSNTLNAETIALDLEPILEFIRERKPVEISDNE